MTATKLLPASYDRQSARAAIPFKVRGERLSRGRVCAMLRSEVNSRPLSVAPCRAPTSSHFAGHSSARPPLAPNAVSATGTAIAARLRREGYDWREQLRALSAPALVVHGEADALPATVANELSQLLPRGRLVLIRNAGHMPFWEAPDSFFSEIDAFLSTSTPGSLRNPR